MTTIDDQLALLISLIEEEKVRLQKLIDDCLAEGEYLQAHYHKEVLFDLNGRLQRLQNLDDPLYDKKSARIQKIEGLQKLMETESAANLKLFFQENLQRAKEELEKLNQMPKQARAPENDSLLDEAFKNLLNNKIKNLKLILKKADNLFLAFSYSKKTLKVTLPCVKQHSKKGLFYAENIGALKNLGFHLSENETKLTLSITGKKEDIINRLKRILSKIVFDIFLYKAFDEECSIQFKERGFTRN